MANGGTAEPSVYVAPSAARTCAPIHRSVGAPCVVPASSTTIASHCKCVKHPSIISRATAARVCAGHPLLTTLTSARAPSRSRLHSLSAARHQESRTHRGAPSSARTGAVPTVAVFAGSFHGLLVAEQLTVGGSVAAEANRFRRVGAVVCARVVAKHALHTRHGLCSTGVDRERQG